METYRINGVEVEYDTFDLVNLELFQQEAAALSRRANEIRTDGESSPAGLVRELCEGVLDFFDLLMGEGTARRCFGTRPNVKDLTEAYRAFVEDVAAEIDRFQREMSGGEEAAPDPVPFPASAPNREQRRAEERARKRREAEARLQTRTEAPAPARD